MTGQELQALRKRLSLSQTKLAAELGKDERTIRRYERDERPVPKLVEKFLAKYVGIFG